ncbi:MAG: Sec-independent protein translocase protein TatB [Alphaproteobacteria bacterium]
MLDIGWSEMLLIIVVMIIVIGPKDLPRALHTLGQWVGQVRRVARQFQDSIEQMAQDSGIDDVRKEIEDVSNFDVEREMEKAVDPKGELGEAFRIEPPDFTDRKDGENARAAAKAEKDPKAVPPADAADDKGKKP